MARKRLVMLYKGKTHGKPIRSRVACGRGYGVLFGLECDLDVGCGAGHRELVVGVHGDG